MSNNNNSTQVQQAPKLNAAAIHQLMERSESKVSSSMSGNSANNMLCYDNDAKGEVSSLSGEDNNRDEDVYNNQKKHRSTNNGNSNHPVSGSSDSGSSGDGEEAVPTKRRKTKHSSHHNNDLTTYEGQMATYPHLSEDDAKLAAKREYNRLNAARARVRHKSKVQGLQETCVELQARADALERDKW